MRTLLTGAIVLCATVAFAEEPFTTISFDDAFKKASEEKKVILIDFYTTWCGPCKMLDRTTWADRKVREWLGKNVIAFKIDADRNHELPSRYGIRGYPTLLFLDDDGKELDRLVGYHDPIEFLEEAKRAIASKDIDARAGAKTETRETSDPVKRMQYGMTYVRKGRMKEALDEFLWCFDHGLETRPAFSGARLSYLLMYIHQLGNKYQPAIKALCDRRNRAERALLDEKSDKKRKASSDYPRSRFEAASEVSAINRELNVPERTAGVYKKLMMKGENDRRILSVLLEEVIDPLIQSNDYSSIVAGLPNPLATVDQLIESYRSIKESEGSNPRDAAPSASEHFKRRVLDQGSKIYEALVGVKDSTNARKIAQRLLKFDGGGGIYESLMEHALRADGHEEVVWLLQLARVKLESEELASLEVLATKSRMY